jgi:hypothetical protein
MRKVLLFAFFACIYLHFQHRGSHVQSDVIVVKQSALKREVPSRKASQLPSISNSLFSEAPKTSETIISGLDRLNEEELAQIDSEDELTSLPWDEIDEGWKTHLKEFLTGHDPEKGEEIFQAYLEEKKKYVERVQYSDSDSGIQEDLLADAVSEQDDKEGELERIHLMNLKDIFGEHFTQVENLHKEYVESIQYLNRTQAKFSVTL